MMGYLYKRHIKVLKCNMANKSVYTDTGE